MDADLAEPIVTGRCRSLKKGLALRAMRLEDGNLELLHPLERASLSSDAIASRQREFAAGRLCAAQAMRDLELTPQPIRMAEDRSPVWSGNLVGSISHSRTLAAAAVANTASGIRAIGLDVEESTPLEEELVEEICLPGERQWLATRRLSVRGLLAKAIFSVKEAVYKCQYPQTRRMFGFDMIEVDLDPEGARFVARFTENVGQFSSSERFAGKFWFADEHIFSLLVLR